MLPACIAQWNNVPKPLIYCKNSKVDCRKTKFNIFIENAEGIGKRRVSQLESAVGIYFRRGKAEVSRLLADGTLALYFCLLVKALNEMRL